MFLKKSKKNNSLIDSQFMKTSSFHESLPITPIINHEKYFFFCSIIKNIFLKTKKQKPNVTLTKNPVHIPIRLTV